MSRQIAKVGDVFWVPIQDGSYVLGQIVEIQKEVLNSITCAFFGVKSNDPVTDNNDLNQPIAIQFVTKDLFNKGTWIRVRNSKVVIPESKLPYRDTRKNGWIGSKIIGSGIIKNFLSAFYGLRDWNEMNDPEYYQKLLCKGIEREVHA